MNSGSIKTSRRRVYIAAISTAIFILAATLLSAVAFPAMSGPDPLAGPAPAVTGAHNDTHTPFNMVSMPTLIAHRQRASRIRFTGTSSPGRGFVRHAISYRNGALRLTGTLVLPNHRPARGVPVVVAVHGWRPPGDYTRGSGLIREENALARAGIAVLHPDLRNYGGSTVEHPRTVVRPLGYPSDVIAGLLALRATKVSGVDTRRVALLGRSMGGGVALQAAIARPDLFDAVELYAPVSSLASDNLQQFQAWSPGLTARVVGTFGTPTSHRQFWSEASARNYVDRLTMPVRIHHGTADIVCPSRWSEATVAAMRSAGVDAKLTLWRGEGHRFERRWPAFNRRTVGWLRSQLN